MLRIISAAALYAVLTASCFGQTTSEVGLFVHFDSTPSPEFFSVMQTELGSILAPAELHLNWLTQSPQNPKQERSSVESRTWLRAVFIRFHGACSALPGSDIKVLPATDRITLAETAVSDGVVLPYTETDCDRLRAFLAQQPEELTGAEQRLGVAMARVIAHELFHVLLQTTEHSKEGIARAAHTPAALLGQSLRFEDGELERIRRKYSSRQNTSFSAN